MDAKTFLRKNNLDGLIKVLVEDNKVKIMAVLDLILHQFIN